jgi:hypothetical protein
VEKKADPGHTHRSHMIPAKGDLVDLGEYKTPPPAGVSDVAIVVHKVVESSISSTGADDPLVLLLIGFRPH